jgi:transposase
VEIPEGYVLIKQSELEYLQKQASMVPVLEATIQKLEGTIKLMEARIKDLEERFKSTSKNSSKPPSSDGFKRTTSLREKSGKKPGGQPGHKGSRLEMSSTPDHVVELRPGECGKCGKALTGAATGFTPRQMFEIPPARIEITEYRSMKIQCCCCGELTCGAFPSDITQQAQYGPRIKAMMSYLSCYQMIPQQRLSEMLENLYGMRVSQGTLNRALQECAANLLPYEDVVYELLKNAPVVGFDETGIHMGGKLIWLHTACTEKLSLLTVHFRRGQEAMNYNGLLKDFLGIALHDRWASYFMFDCLHALCNAHLLRELKYLWEVQHCNWATALSALMIKAKSLTEMERPPSERQIRNIENRYSKIVAWGLRTCTLEGGHVMEKKARGSAKQSKAKNLLDNLKLYKAEFLRFLRNPDVRFDNNISERDLRMSKVKMKISGGFRSEWAPAVFASIRGYINTAKKNGQEILSVLTQAFVGEPFMPLEAV